MARLKTLKPALSVIKTTIAPPPREIDPFYSSRAWRALVAEIIAERGRRCEECGRTGVRIYADHIVELKDGGAPLDKRNVRLLDGSCHTRKTLREREKRFEL